MSPKLLYVASILVAMFFVTMTVAEEDQQAGSEIEDKIVIVIETLIPAPEDCQRKSKRYDQLSMHYIGTLTETGIKFDASYDRNQPFNFQIGAGQVIKGWDEGLLDMCVGEKRKLIIPSSKGYGETGAGELIPPNAGLTFEVELVNIEDGSVPQNVFKEIDTDGDNQLSQDEVSDYLKKQAAKAGSVPEETDQHKEIVTQIFNHEDKDKDGFISHDEFSGPKHDEL